MNKVQEALKAAIEAINEARNQIKELCDVHNTPYPITSLVRYNQAIKGCKSALSDIEKCEPVADALRFLKSHDCVDDEGYEYGICKVKFDNSGKAAEVLWSDIDAVIKLKTKKGIV